MTYNGGMTDNGRMTDSGEYQINDNGRQSEMTDQEEWQTMKNYINGNDRQWGVKDNGHENILENIDNGELQDN